MPASALAACTCHGTPRGSSAIQLTPPTQTGNSSTPETAAQASRSPRQALRSANSMAATETPKDRDEPSISACRGVTTQLTPTVRTASAITPARTRRRRSRSRSTPRSTSSINCSMVALNRPVSATRRTSRSGSPTGRPTR